MMPFAAMRMRTPAGGGGGGGGAHEYWRIAVNVSLTPGAAGGVDIGELIMRDVPAGTNLCTGGTAFGTAPGGNGPDKAFDGNNGTFWDTYGSGANPAFCGYQFAAPVEIVEYEMAVGAGDSFMPYEWDFQSSDDGSSWTTVDHRTGVTWSGGASQTFSI